MFCISFILINSTCFSQGIQFSDLNYENGLAKAKHENKILMVVAQFAHDPFAKQMEVIYKDTSLYTFFNSRVLSIKVVLDRNKKEDRQFMQQFSIEASPAYLFIDGENEKLLARHQGRTNTVAEFLQIAKKATGGFCFSFNEVVLDYPYNFDHLLSDKITNTIKHQVTFESTVTLPDTRAQEIIRSLDRNTGRLILASFSVLAEDDIPSEAAGLRRMDYWRKKIMSCDFSATGATRVTYRNDKLNGYNRIIIELNTAANAYKGFQIQLFLFPNMNLSGISGYRLVLSIEKPVK